MSNHHDRLTKAYRGLNADVRRMAGTEAFKPMHEGMIPDADYLAAMRAGLAQLAESE